MYERSKLVDSMRKQSLLKEIRILKRLDHPNIIKLYEALGYEVKKDMFNKVKIEKI